MKSKIKIVSVFLIFLLVLGMSGCVDTPGEDSTDGMSEEVENTNDKIIDEIQDNDKKPEPAKFSTIDKDEEEKTIVEESEPVVTEAPSLKITNRYGGGSSSSGSSRSSSDNTANNIEVNQRIDTLIIGTTDNYVDKLMKFHYGNAVSESIGTEKLLELNRDGDYIPCLIESWEISEDECTWTFHLIENAKWNDGTPFTAEDVVFSCEYYNEKYTKPGRYEGANYSTPDDYTVITTLPEPRYDWLHTFGRTIPLPKHIWEDVEDPYGDVDINQSKISTAPYIFEGYDYDAGTFSFTSFDDYHGGTPVVKNLVFKKYNNMDSLVMALQKEEIDLFWCYGAGISFEYVPQLLDSDDIDIMSYENNGISNGLFFNCMKDYCNANYRNAVSYAINYDEINTLFTAGYGADPRRGFIPNNGYAHYKETPELEYNVTKANEMLDELGFIDIDGDGFRELPDGSEFKPLVIARSDKPETSRLTERLTVYFEDAGIEVETQLVDFSTLLKMAWTSKIAPEDKVYDMMISRTTYYGMVDYSGYGTNYIGANDYCGWACYNDTEFLELEEGLKYTIDEGEREVLVHSLMDHYDENLPVITLYNMDIIQPYHSKYSGFVLDPFWGILSPHTFLNLEKAE
ncbi:ABC transporter substrate-binding protein [uncultured Methanolobus sp.]|uniref:ABC transporter substrate-binding protein n=1 Tax=uncultured Methanolobus sp. TaxID=218300 RepID=UPI0029C6322D|nr:ABC transporter substrate-binding protein [uncultured Methanolobus sp.]